VNTRFHDGVGTTISSERHLAVSGQGQNRAMTLDVRTELPPSIRTLQERLRIAVVTETYPPEVNGVAGTISQIVEGLRRRGHEVQLIRPRQPRDGAAGPERGAESGFTETLTRGVAIPRYPELRMGLPIARRLRGDWILERPDVVHIATEGPLGWSALSTARRLGIPVLTEFRTNFHSYMQHYGIGFLQPAVLAYLRKFHNQAACTMVPTAGLRRELEATGFHHLEVVARGVDTELFQPARRCPDLRRMWGVLESEPVILSVGRLAPEKNLELLGETYGRIRQRVPAARLVVVGDGPARDLARSLCPTALFAGRRTGEELARHYASADVFLFPSLTETFGNVTLEAMASGLAVAAFDYGAAGANIRTGVSGWVAPFGDRGAFVRGSVQLAMDVALARRLGRKARDTAVERGWNAILDQVESLYLRSITEFQSRRSN